MKKVLFAIFSLMSLYTQGTYAQGIDCTGLVGGAACDDAGYWYIKGVEGYQVSHPGLNPDPYPTLLECDTWSTRGGKDGSNMLTPFMEY